MGADSDSGGASLLPALDHSTSAPPPSSGLPPVAAAANLLDATSWLTPPGTTSTHARFASAVAPPALEEGETRVRATVAVARGAASGRAGGPRALTASMMPPPPPPARFPKGSAAAEEEEEEGAAAAPPSSSAGTGAATRDTSGGGGRSHEGAAA